MKTFNKYTCKVLIMTCIFIIGTFTASNAQIFNKKQAKASNKDYITYKGKILDKKTSEALIFASIRVEDENTATITNSEGEFTLKINKKSKAKNIIISHIGYKNLVYPIIQLASNKILFMEKAVLSLSEVHITPDYPEMLVRKMLSNIKKNYPQQANNMIGFYREAIEKGNSYVSLSEAIVDIYKPAYKGFTSDQVHISKGRKGVNVKKMDTLLFKLQGGPTTTLLLDVIKNNDVLMSFENIGNYNFELLNEIKINNRLNFVIEFNQNKNVESPLYSGVLYIDTETLALSAADFSLNIENSEKASEMFIRKIPWNVKLTPKYANYSIRYQEKNGKWYFSYAKGEVKFKVNWKRKLFNNHYTAMFEIAITDRSDKNVYKFYSKERFRSVDIFSESLNAFSAEDYWGKYNIIEPDRSIETAIRKFNKILNN